MSVSIGATPVSTTSHLGFDTTADKAAGEPLAQWLTVVALKVWYLLACRFMWPTNLTLSPCWEIDRKKQGERQREGQECYCEGWWCWTWKGTSVWRLPNSFLHPLSPPPSISPMASRGEWQVSLLSLPLLLSCLRALWPGRGLMAQLLLPFSFLLLLLLFSISIALSLSICFNL